MAQLGSVSIEELVQGVKDGMSVKRVFGDPYERDGVTIIPVAKVGGGGGAGGGGAENEGGGSGGAFGMGATPMGVYVIKNGEVSWRPAVDVNKVIAGAQLATFLVLLTLRGVLKRRAKKH